VWIVDRLEEVYIVCEDENGRMQTLHRALLPENVTSGDVLVFKEGVWHIDSHETASRRARIQKKLANLWEDETLP
jgi:hypothetical protein